MVNTEVLSAISGRFAAEYCGSKIEITMLVILKDGVLHGEGASFLHRNGRLRKFRGVFERNEFVGWRWVKPVGRIEM